MTPNDEQKSDVFEYGDRTMFQLRSQSFAIDDDYGTMITPGAVLPVVEAAPAAEPLSDDPIARLEQKLDTALRMLATLQQKIDSLDVTLARALNR